MRNIWKNDSSIANIENVSTVLLYNQKIISNKFIKQGSNPREIFHFEERDKYNLVIKIIVWKNATFFYKKTI